jgi:hypothetical protein
LVLQCSYRSNPSGPKKPVCFFRPLLCLILPKKVQGLKSAYVRSRFPNSVPQGRLNLAQDASPGYITKHDSVPQGRLKVVQDCVAAYFQPSLRDWSSLKLNPGLASWAKFSRPCGTEFGNRLLTHALKPGHCKIKRSRGFENPLPRTKVRGLPDKSRGLIQNQNTESALN